MADAASIIHLSDALWEILLGKVTLWLLSSQYHKSIRIMTSQVIDRRDLSFQVKNKKGRKGLVPRCLVISGWKFCFSPFTIYIMTFTFLSTLSIINRGEIIIKKETNKHITPFRLQIQSQS